VLIPVLGSQPAGDVNHKPGVRLRLLSARTAVTLATLKGKERKGRGGGERKGKGPKGMGKKRGKGR